MALSGLHVAGMGHRLGGARARAGRSRARRIPPCGARWSGCCASRFADDAPGDWRVKCGRTRGNGWAFEFDNDAYPDIDDTDDRRARAAREAATRATSRSRSERARDWTLAMRSKNGAWAAFDRDNTRELLYRMPFCRFRRDDRSADRRRDRARARDARARSAATTSIRSWRAASRICARRSGRAARGTAAGASTTCTARGASSRRWARCGAGRDMIERGAAWLICGAEPGRRMGRKLPLVRGRIVCRHRARARPRRPPGPSTRCRSPGSGATSRAPGAA